LETKLFSRAKVPGYISLEGPKIIIKVEAKNAARVHHVIEKRGNWYIGYVEELPGVNTQGKSLKEVRENLKEALCLIVKANRDLAGKSQANILRSFSNLKCHCGEPKP